MAYSRLDDAIEATLLENRRLFFTKPVSTESVTDAIRKLWFLELTAPGEPITFVINSPGGSVDAGFALWDQVKLISSPVTTLVTGIAASMGSILSLCAAPGRRFATPRSRILIHQPSMTGMFGPAADLEIHANEILKTRDMITDLYVDATGRPRDEIERALDRDKWFTAEEAVEFGLLDRIINSYEELA